MSSVFDSLIRKKMPFKRPKFRLMNLPDELIYAILQYHQAQPEILLACMGASRKLHSIAKDVLYERPWAREWKSVQSLVNVLKEQPDLAAKVQELSLHMFHDCPHKKGKYKWRPPTILPLNLPKLPICSQVTVYGKPPSTPSMDHSRSRAAIVSWREVLHWACQCDQLRRIHLDGCALRVIDGEFELFEIEMESLGVMLPRSLTELSISSMTILSGSGGDPQELLWSLCRPWVQSLTLGQAFDMTIPSNGSLVWIAGADSPIKVLDIQTMMFPPALPEQALFPFLEGLRCPFVYICMVSEPFPALRDVAFIVDYERQDLYRIAGEAMPHLCDGLRGRMFPSLKQLKIVTKRDVVASEADELVQCQTTRHIKKVVLDSQLGDICSRRGIQLIAAEEFIETR
jgi:hypothetical protein